MNKKTINLAVCEGRHDMPSNVTRAIFPQRLPDIKNTLALEDWALGSLFRQVKEEGCTFKTCYLNVYVTGLTVAVVAIINICHEYGISVSLWHHDRETGEYFEQKVF